MLAIILGSCVWLVANFSLQGEEKVFFFVVFDNQLENVMIYEWDFGDGNIFELVEFSYIYWQFGNYIIFLKVINEKGKVRVIE